MTITDIVHYLTIHKNNGVAIHTINAVRLYDLCELKEYPRKLRVNSPNFRTAYNMEPVFKSATVEV